MAGGAPYPRPVAQIEQPPLRKDAERSRTAILTAARELFGSGRDVPMYEIGRYAGVGQATLYRHFPDRSALIAALAREHVTRIEAVAAQHDDNDQAVFAVLRAATEMLVSLHGVVGILRQDVSLAPVLHELRQRMLAVLDHALDNSRGSGELRVDLEARDLQLVLNMITGALNGIPTPAERAAAAQRALELAVTGIRRPAA
jgi:AcrR family transcriptional regulator